MLAFFAIVSLAAALVLAAVAPEMLRPLLGWALITTTLGATSALYLAWGTA